MSFELPAQFAQFGDARKNGFPRVKNIKENGGKVAGTFCTFTPQEILDAAEAHLPKNMCPLIKSSCGFAEIDLQACTTYSVESYTVHKLMEELGVPYMAIETGSVPGNAIRRTKVYDHSRSKGRTVPHPRR